MSIFSMAEMEASLTSGTAEFGRRRRNRTKRIKKALLGKNPAKRIATVGTVLGLGALSARMLRDRDVAKDAEESTKSLALVPRKNRRSKMSAAPSDETAEFARRRRRRRSSLRSRALGRTRSGKVARAAGATAVGAGLIGAALLSRKKAGTVQNLLRGRGSLPQLSGGRGNPRLGGGGGGGGRGRLPSGSPRPMFPSGGAALPLVMTSRRKSAR